MRAEEVIQDRYHLEEALGHGGMAEVWRATDERLRRTVAIKFLSPQLSEDPEFLVRFFAEAQAIARISHRNVVQVLDFGQHDDRPYLVMEFVPGGSLTQRMGTPVPADEAVRLVAAAAQGAGAAHDAGIVHRDLKPANILLRDGAEPKLADFGIAASSRAERLTATGAAIGSPHYISPEQASGGIPTPASDVYSLGIVLYELLTGRRPFDGDNVTAIAIAQVEEVPEPPSAIQPELDASLDALVMKCLAKDPEARFADGNELAAALAHGREPRATVAAVEGPAALPRWTRRRAFVAAALAVLLTGLVVGVSARDREPAVADDDHETKENVGGLELPSPSPSPTDGEDRSGARPQSPSPSPSKDEPEPEESETPEEKKQKGSGKESTGSSPSPTPEPSDDAPSPEPTSEEGSPAP